MNQYERAKHSPDWLTVENLALALHVPTVYFYAQDDDAAELILAFYRLPAGKRAAAVQTIQTLA